MAKIAFLIAFLLNSMLAFGQTSPGRLVRIAGSAPDNKVQVVFEQGASSMSRYITFERKNTMDTVFLSMQEKFQSNSCKIEQIQIDGKGLEEIHITWMHTKPFGLGDYIGGETSWGEQLKFVHHEIWNLDKKQRIFNAVSLYSLERYTIHHGVEEQKTITHSFWSYDFIIDERGRIAISNSQNSKDQTPDNTEGSYVFSRGEYHKK